MKLSKFSKRSKPASMVGHLDHFSQGQLFGWALDKENPDTPLKLIVSVGGKAIAEVTADTYREDLFQSKVGTGHHGFSVAVPVQLNPGQSLDVTLLSADSGQSVASNAFQIKRAHALRIEIEKIDAGRLIGVIHDADSIDLDGRLCLLVDGTVVSTGHNAEQVGNKYHFAIPLPRAVFDSSPHTFTVIVDNEPGTSAAWVDIVPANQTPWTYLASSASSNGYAAIPRTAGYRYESLRQQLAAFANESVSSAISLQNLMTAHTVVLEGYEGRRNFPRLSLPVTDSPLVSIVIPVHNKFSLTYHCLASLALAFNKATFEVIVVDDCSSDETLNLPQYVDNVRLVVNETNLGFLLSCNKGAAIARGKYVVMLNNDTEVTSCWLDEMIDVFERAENVGMVGSKLLYPDGTLQEAGGIVWSTGEPWNLGNGKNPNHPSFSYTRQADYLSGASVMLSAEVWKRVGGFSEEFAPAYYEDTDLAFKVRDAGFKTVYCPFSVVIHFEGMSNGRDLTKGIKKHQRLNEPKFRAKWVDAYRYNGRVGEDIRINMDRGVTHRALMIDYSIPRPDQDAGSYAAVQEARMLQANGFKVTFVAENMAHLGKYTDELQRIGVECIYAPFYNSVHDLLSERGGEFNLVYITRFDVAERHLENVRKFTKAKILFNNADLHFLRELRAALAAKQTDLSGPLATRDRELSLMRRVDAIFSYNPVEHAVITSHNLREDNMFLCPWVVEYKGHKNGFQNREDIAFLGGYRHKPNVEAVLFFVKQVMPQLRERIPGIKFRIYGSGVPAEIEALACEDVIVEGFVETLDEVFETCRVFVAPLLSGAGIKGKVLDALSYAVPSVLSPIAAEGTGVSDGTTAFIASEPREWVDAIASLYTNQEIWEGCAEKLQGLVERNYSFAGGVARFDKPLRYLGIFQSRTQPLVFEHR